MKILIVNTNSVVQKLIEITTRKMHIENLVLASLDDLTMIKNIGEYQLVVIDDGVLMANSEGFLKILSDVHTCLLYSKENQRIGEFDFAIKKPFLPNELLNILVSLRAEIPQEEKPQEIKPQKEENKEVEEVSILDDLDSEDEGLNHILSGIESKLLEDVPVRMQDVQDLDRQEDLIYELQKQIQQEKQQTQPPKLEDEPLFEDKRAIFDENELAEIKELLGQTQMPRQEQAQNNQIFEVLQSILRGDESMKRLRDVLDGMQITISFSKQRD